MSFPMGHSLFGAPLWISCFSESLFSSCHDIRGPGPTSKKKQKGSAAPPTVHGSVPQFFDEVQLAAVESPTKSPLGSKA